MADPLADLSSRGVSIWLDDLSRQRLVTEILEKNGPAAFDNSWRELGEQLASRLRLPARGRRDSRTRTV